MEKFYIESSSTIIRTFSFVGMIIGNDTVKVISAIAMIAVNVAKVCYEYRHSKKVLKKSSRLIIMKV